VIFLDAVRYIAIEGEASTWEEAIRLCGNALVKHQYTDERFIEECIEREKRFPTGLPCVIPVAIPHSQSDGILKTAVCVLRLHEPVNFYRMDDQEQAVETRIIFNMAIKGADDHLVFLQKLMGFVTNQEMVKQCQDLPIQKLSSYLEEKLA
jgi:PTS system galactitol-specific IIA component